MADNSKIEWTDHTFNPWVGCTKVSAGCDHCYAEAWAKRSGQVQWGNAPRRRTSVANWKKPLKWDRSAGRSGVRDKVFCASLADVFDNQVDPEWRRDLWSLIGDCPSLDWLLLTKRPQNMASMLPPDWGDGWPNVWLGTTVEDQERADQRIPDLLATPAAVRFLSCEPLLGSVDLTEWLWCFEPCANCPCPNPFKSTAGMEECCGEPDLAPSKLHWVICGGESGPGARDMCVNWANELRDECRKADVPFFMKQMARKAPIPDDLMVRQWPGRDYD